MKINTKSFLWTNKQTCVITEPNQCVVDMMIDSP